MALMPASRDVYVRQTDPTGKRPPVITQHLAWDPARFIDHHDVLHAARLRLARARDDAGAPAAGIRDHANWPPPQARVAQLLDGSEESIKIKIKVFNRRWFSHGLRPESGEP